MAVAGEHDGGARYSSGVARDLGPRNITLNVVRGGIMRTDMAGASADEIPAAVLDMHPILRIATVEEVAASVIYLAGPDAGALPVDHRSERWRALLTRCASRRLRLPND
jgi:NAD(P)-dependent dehydrogenase (short-subunit alcohol dehydrogenase family)